MKRESIVIVLLTILLLFVINFYFAFFIPRASGAPDLTVEIADGLGIKQIAHNLESAGIIRNAAGFYLLGRFTGKGPIKSGEYSLNPDMSPLEILGVLREGRVLQHKITIPEGLTIFQIADFLSQQGWVRRETFLDLCKDTEVLEYWNIKNNTVEGYLFPETYFFSRGVSERQIIYTMIKYFWRVFNTDMIERSKEIGLGVYQVVTLASLIEKETALPEERPLVSAVFHNRLKAGIRLQCDPTVIYGLDSFDGDLTKRDLRTVTPYNTYRNKGLPPGPIANPGLGSIRAALYPADVNYIYFVSKNDGSHEFSETLAQHNRAVSKYQKGRIR